MRLLSGLCHEMGNVLTATRLYAQFLTDEIGPEEVLENAGEVDHLSGVASQLLLLVRPIVAPLERGRGVAEPRDVLERVQASLEPARKGVEVRIAFDSSAGVSRVNMDGDLLQTFITTLIQEACQGLPDRGRVDVRVEAGSGPVVFVIEDNGEEDEALFTSTRRRSAVAHCDAQSLITCCGNSKAEWKPVAKGLGPALNCKFPLPKGV